MHEFIKDMTKDINNNDNILLLGDFNMFTQPMNDKTKTLIQTNTFKDAKKRNSYIT